VAERWREIARNLGVGEMVSAEAAGEAIEVRDKRIAELEKAINDVDLVLGADGHESCCNRVTRITKLKSENKELRAKKQDWLDSVYACLIAAGAPEDIDKMEAVVKEAGTKPSDFIRKRITDLEQQRNNLLNAAQAIIAASSYPAGSDEVTEALEMIEAAVLLCERY
jgi:hypothetical protein